MRRVFLLAGVVFLSLTPLRADDVDQAFSDWKTTMEFSAKRLGEKVLITFNREKGLLVVGKELTLSPSRTNTLLQTVPVALLAPGIELEGSTSMPEPWIKVRCKDGQKKVKNESRVIVDGVEVTEVTKTGDKAFFVITCHRTDLKKAKEQGEKFLALVTK